MKRTMIVAAAALTVAAGAPPAANAEPAAAPQPGSACPESFADTMTAPPDGQTFLACQSVPGGHLWQTVAEPFDPSDRWLSYGPALTLHGQGRRNPEILSGQWTATPQDATSSCGAEQAPVTDAGVGPPQLTTGRPGQPLDFAVVPVVFTITLTGYCLWERVSAGS